MSLWKSFKSLDRDVIEEPVKIEAVEEQEHAQTKCPEDTGGETPTTGNTEVIIIGNGPSGICLSYLLSGHWPFYTGSSNGIPLPDEALHARLMGAGGSEQSLVEQDLDFLSSGLEGRSSNPVALLLDSLSNPGADIGFKIPSQLRWEGDQRREIPHIVLGRGETGGVWQCRGDQAYNGGTKTVSLRSWMELPGMSLEDWLNENKPNRRWTDTSDTCRASMEDIFKYYREYVRRQGLTRYFHNHSTVTSLTRIATHPRHTDCECGEPEEEEEEEEEETGQQPDVTLWEVCGYRSIFDPCGKERRVDFRYTAPNVVLATGTFDTPVRLGVEGEHLPYIVHSYHELERRLVRNRWSFSDPVVVIGAGLTAADAILELGRKKVPTVHLHREDTPGGVYRQLTPTVYPEYHEIYRLMHCEDTAEWYSGNSGVEVLGFTADGDVLIGCGDPLGLETAIRASLVAVLIGSESDLTFICPSTGKDLGVLHNAPIDGKRNRADVDPLTYECLRHPGLYAMGPLVGDHMVRFLRGGALAITSHVWRKRQKPVVTTGHSK